MTSEITSEACTCRGTIAVARANIYRMVETIQKMQGEIATMQFIAKRKEVKDDEQATKQS